MAFEAIMGSMGGGALGTLFVRLTADHARLFTGLNQAEARMRTSTAVMSRQAGLMAAGVSTSLAIVGFAAIREFAKFDKAMTQAFSIMGELSEDVQKRMKDVARTMATESVKSAEDMAKSYFFLASAGLDAEQAMAALPALTKFATAGNFDMARATNFLADATTALGLRSKDAQENLTGLVRVSDVLAKANALAAGEIEDFSEALTNKAAAALRVVNKDVEEGVAVLAVLANQGLKGAAAGESLAISLRDLQRTAVMNQDAFEEFGITVFDSNGAMKNMADIIGDLEEAFKGASTEEKRMAFQLLGFQDRSLAALIALLGFSEQIRTYERELRNAGGMTDRIANVTLTSFSAQLTITGNRVKEILIVIGESLAPALLDLNKNLQEVTKANSAANESLKDTARIMGTVLTGAVKGVIMIWEGWRDLMKLVAIGLLNYAQTMTNFFSVLLDVVTMVISKIEELVRKGLNVMIDRINDLIFLLPNVLKKATGLTRMGNIKETFVPVDFSELQKKIDDATKLFKHAQQEIQNSLIRTTYGAAKETKAQIDLIKGFGEVAGEVAGEVEARFQAMADTIVDSGNKIKTFIGSAKVNELLNALGLPHGMRPKQGPSAADLLKSMGMGEEGRFDPSKAAEMLRAAGLGEGGGSGMEVTGGLEGRSIAIQSEISMNQEKLRILEELGKMEISLNEEVQKRKADAIKAYNERVKQLQLAQAQLVVQSGQEMFDALSEAAAGFAGEQSEIYKVMFAASKAFAIAESLIKIQQGIANALSLPWPANLVAVASVVTAAANIVSSIQAVQLKFGGERALGGPVSSGKAFLVGEQGPEMFVPGSSGNIVPNDGLITKVIINNFSDIQPEVTERTDEDGRILEINLRRMKNDIASEIRDGRGEIPRAMESTFGLRRGRR